MLSNLSGLLKKGRRVLASVFAISTTPATSLSMSALPFPSSIFLSHGPGPLFCLEPGGTRGADKNSPAAETFRTMASRWPKPDAIVIISAHWETKKGQPLRVTSNAQPGLIYDYYGFPEESYKLTYPAPGSPELANEIVSLLKADNIDCVADDERGFDHGVFIPLLLLYPQADIPVVALSLSGNLDPEFHVRVGTALSSLSAKKVLIIGSGEATHNMGDMDFGARPGFETPTTAAVNHWLTTTMTADNISPAQRREKLVNWEKDMAPFGRKAHPREEHFLPLHVAAGAARCQKAVEIANGTILGGLSLQSYAFEPIATASTPEL